MSPRSNVLWLIATVAVLLVCVQQTNAQIEEEFVLFSEEEIAVGDSEPVVEDVIDLMNMLDDTEEQQQQQTTTEKEFDDQVVFDGSELSTEQHEEDKRNWLKNLKVFDDPVPRVLAVTIIWNGDITAQAEDSVFRLSSHPNVGGTLKVVMSSIHRARNHAIQYLLQGPYLKEFTHLLFIDQDVSFTIEDFEKLLLSGKDVVAGLQVKKHYPFTPAFVPKEGTVGYNGQSVWGDWSWFDADKHTEPFAVEATSFGLSLFKLTAFLDSVKVYGNKLEWWWISGEQFVPFPHYIEDEDLTVARALNDAGHTVYVHPQVQVGIVSTTVLQYKNTKNKQHVDAVLKDFSPTGLPVLVEHKIRASEQHGRTYTLKDKQKRANVVLATACWTGIHPNTHGNIWGLAQHPDIIGRVSIAHQTVVIARNELVKLVQKEFGDVWTHILFVDADMTFSLEDYDKLIRSDVGIIFGLAVKRLLKDHPPAYMPLSGDPRDHDALITSMMNNPIEPIQVKGGGMAFTLIKREVFDAVEQRDSRGEPYWFWCLHYVDENAGFKHHLSEDYTFGKLAREKGYPVYMHPGVQLGHIDDVELDISAWFDAQGWSWDRSGTSK